MKRHLKKFYLLFVFVPVLVVLFITVLPAIASILLSMVLVDPPDFMWRGLFGFREIFANGFGGILFSTLIAGVAAGICVNIIAFLLAYLVSRVMKIARVFKFAIVLPGFIPTVIAVSMINLLSGGVLESFGLTGSDTGTMIQAFIGANWQIIGFAGLIYLFAFIKFRRNKNLLDASKVEGVSSLRTFFKVRFSSFRDSIVISFSLTFLYVLKFMRGYILSPSDDPLTAYSFLFNQNILLLAQSRAVVFFIINALLVLAIMVSLYRAQKSGVL
jgi:raffinose/stachyose/melibiose transport system permease protein